MQRVVAKTALTLVAVAAALFAAVQPFPGSSGIARAGACSEIVVGAALSLTGEHSAAGIQVRQGYEYARQRLNEAGGIMVHGRCHNLRIIYSDDESSPGRAAQLTERLIARDNVRLLLGPHGAAQTAAVATVAARYQVPVVSVAGAIGRAADAGERRFLFPIRPAPFEQLGGLVDYVAHLAPQLGHEPGDLRFAILHDTARAAPDARADLRQRAREFGISILEQAFGHRAGDLDQALARLKSERPDVVMIDAHAGATNRAFRALADMQLDPPILAVTDCTSARLIARHGRRAQNVLCSAPQSEMHKTFTAAGPRMSCASRTGARNCPTAIRCWKARKHLPRTS